MCVLKSGQPLQTKLLLPDSALSRLEPDMSSLVRCSAQHLHTNLSWNCHGDFENSFLWSIIELFFMRIAKIIKSNSHVDYAARVLDSLETTEPPSPTDYCFGQFIKVVTERGEAVGVIYNSLLINPEYGNYGPRLSTPPELNSVFSPDYLHEQGIMVGVLLLGWKLADSYQHGFPREVLPINANVENMTSDEIRNFHHNAQGAIEVHYYAHVTTHAGNFAFPLLSEIADQLEKVTTESERARLTVLRKTLAWQQTMGKLR